MSQPATEKDRWIRVTWAEDISESYFATLRIIGKDRSGLVMDIATVLNALNSKVRGLSAKDIGDGNAITTVDVEVKDIVELRNIVNKLSGVSGVSQVSRSS